MGQRLDERDLRAWAFGSVREQVEAFGSAHSDSVQVGRPGLLAAIDRAYGFGTDGFAAGIAGETSIRWHGALAGTEPLGCGLGFLEMWELRR